MTRRLLAVIFVLVATVAFSQLYEGRGGKMISEDLRLYRFERQRPTPPPPPPPPPPQTYTITFLDRNGDVYSSSSYEQGATVTVPVYANVKWLSHVGWTPELVAYATDNATYTPVYAKVESVGFNFELSANPPDSYAIISSQITSNNNAHVFPSENNGLPVTTVKNNVTFLPSPVYVTMPATIVRFERNAVNVLRKNTLTDIEMLGVTTLSVNMFLGCNSLTRLYVPSCTKIISGAFLGNPIESITFGNRVPETDNAFANIGHSFTVKYPASAQSAWQEGTNNFDPSWGGGTNIIYEAYNVYDSINN